MLYHCFASFKLTVSVYELFERPSYIRVFVRCRHPIGSDDITILRWRRLCVMPPTRRGLSELKNRRRRWTVDDHHPAHIEQAPAVTMTSSSRDGGCRQQLASFVPLSIIAAVMLSLAQGEAMSQSTDSYNSCQQLLSSIAYFSRSSLLGERH